MNPFADDASVVTIGDLAIENGTDRVLVHGALEIERTRTGLERAQALQARIATVVASLEAVEDLPESLPPRKDNVATIRNPFDR